MFTDEERRRVLAILDAPGVGDLLLDDGRLRVELSRSASAAPAPVSHARTMPSGPDPAMLAVRAPAAGSFRGGLPVGAMVAEAGEVGAIEAAGRTLPVVAGRSGRIAGVFAHDGDFVEYGQLLLALETGG